MCIFVLIGADGDLNAQNVAMVRAKAETVVMSS